MPTRRGSIRIFRLFGIDVYLHYSWLLVAILRVQFVQYRHYDSLIWYILEYVSLFGIVLTHEFGHALACRQVGGQANQIVLWPFGGVAYIAPPQRPGAMLWSIAAGPLVNVALFPVFLAFWFCGLSLGWPDTCPNLYLFLRTLLLIDIGLFIFNMLPVFPLDGGQILRSLLWYPFGRANSLLISSIVGFVGVAGFGVIVLLAWLGGDRVGATWFGVMDALIAWYCWSGLQQALALSRLEKAPRRSEYHCPVCRESPPIGEFWRCGRCGAAFDTFLTQSFCPRCNAEYNVTACPYCYSGRPMAEWRG
jgi:Zn-dependent protease